MKTLEMHGIVCTFVQVHTIAIIIFVIIIAISIKDMQLQW